MTLELASSEMPRRLHKSEKYVNFNAPIFFLWPLGFIQTYPTQYDLQLKGKLSGCFDPRFLFALSQEEIHTRSTIKMSKCINLHLNIFVLDRVMAPQSQALFKVPR